MDHREEFCIRPRAKLLSSKSHSVKTFLGVQEEHGSLSALVPHALCNVAIMASNSLVHEHQMQVDIFT